MKTKIDTFEAVAYRLIEGSKPVTEEHAELFGYERPFGTRWTVSSKFVNAVPSKSLTRKVVVYNRNGPELSLANEFDKLYPDDRTRHLVPGKEIAQSLTDIFVGVHVNTRSIHGVGGQYARELSFHYPIIDRASAEIMTADLGRMMLVDSLLYGQGFRNESRMSINTASLVEQSFNLG